MALFKFFHRTKTLEEDIQREKACIARIKTETVEIIKTYQLEL